MKLLITGATGFVGRNTLLTALREKKYDTIYVPVRSVEKIKKQFEADGYSEIPANVKVIETSAPDWNLSSVDSVDHVIHSAGVLFEQTKRGYFDTNVDGTLNLFHRLPRPKRAVVLSSQSASGPCRTSQAFKQEEDEDKPLTLYGQSKLEMERRLRLEFNDLNYLCLRPPMIFGARDQATLPLFKMAKNPLLFKPGIQSKRYSFISIKDLIGAIFAALEADVDWELVRGKHFFVASNAPITDRYLLKSAARVSEKRGMIVTVPHSVLWGVSRVIDTIPTWRATVPSLSVDRAKEIWPRRWVISSKAFQSRFGWKPNEDFLTTLNDTRDWYVKSGQLSA